MDDDIQILADRVRAEIPIADIVSEIAESHSNAGELHAMCPFHEDSQLTLTVNAQENGWRCWPCDISGDSIDLWMATRDLSFAAAVIQLANRLD